MKVILTTSLYDAAESGSHTIGVHRSWDGAESTKDYLQSREHDRVIIHCPNPWEFLDALLFFSNVNLGEGWEYWLQHNGQEMNLG